METIKKIFTGIGAFVVLILVIGLIFVFPTKWLWNWLMPTIFNLPVITAWQAFGLMILSGILFRSSSSSKKE